MDEQDSVDDEPDFTPAATAPQGGRIGNFTTP